MSDFAAFMIAFSLYFGLRAVAEAIEQFSSDAAEIVVGAIDGIKEVEDEPRKQHQGG